jgi:putative copper resistance protein D
MTIVGALAFARWMHFMAAAVLFGMPLFSFYALSDREARFGAHHAAIVAASAMTAISGLIWLDLSIVNMTGETNSLFDIELWQNFLFETGFGLAWLIRLTILAAIVAVALLGQPGWIQSAFMVALGGLLLADQAWLGHAAAEEGWISAIAIAAYVVHVVAASAWIGGLLPLALELSHLKKVPSETALHTSIDMLRRFSTMGIVAVCAILASGVVNTLLRVGSWQGFGTDYGRALTIKLVLFAFMLTTAGVNRFGFMPRMLTHPATTRMLRYNVALELLGGVAVLAAAAILGLQPPPA